MTVCCVIVCGVGGGKSRAKKKCTWADNERIKYLNVRNKSFGCVFPLIYQTKCHRKRVKLRNTLFADMAGRNQNNQLSRKECAA